MESTQKEATQVQTAIQKTTKEFDELFLMDNLSLSEGVDSSSMVCNGLAMAGSTFPRAVRQNKGQQPRPHTFTDCDSSSFQLRVGPNYAKTGAKAAGGLSLYESVGAE